MVTSVFYHYDSQILNVVTRGIILTDVLAYFAFSVFICNKKVFSENIAQISPVTPVHMVLPLCEHKTGFKKSRQQKLRELSRLQEYAG